MFTYDTASLRLNRLSKRFLQVNGSTCSSFDDPSETVSTVSDKQNLIPADRSDSRDRRDKNLTRILYDLPVTDTTDTHSAFDDAPYYV